MKDKSKEEKILEEIRKRVIEFESHNQEKEDLESLRKANIQALNEMSSLSQEEILRLSFQVRKEFEAKETRRKMLIALCFVILIVIAAIWGIRFLNKQKNTFVETFDDNSKSWGLYDDIKYERKIENGNYILQTGHDGWCYWDATNIIFPEYFAVELSSVWEKGEKKSEYGIGLYQDDANTVCFSLFPDGEASFAQYQNDKWVIDNEWTGRIANGEGKENLQRVEIKRSTNQFKYFVNGQLAKEGTFLPLTLRKVGFRSCGMQKVSFKSLKVIDLNTNRTIFNDDFETVQNDRWVLKKEIIAFSEIKDGQYLLETNVIDKCFYVAQYYTIDQSQDVNIILKMKSLQGVTSDFGLTFIQDEVNFYSLDYQNNGKARYTLYEDDKYTITSSYKNTNIASSANLPWINMKVEIRRGKVNYFINETFVESFTLKNDFLISKIGIRVCDEQKVAFDELQIVPQ
jgi:hypothetical protein